MMKKIPDEIDAIFCRRMKNAGIDYELQQEYRKWLRFYLDFCDKYYLIPTDHDSPQRFMQKLNEKGQSTEKQKQASQSVNVYLDIIAKEALAPEIRNAEERPGLANCDTKKKDSGWSAVFKNLNDAIRIRNYSKKTFRTYAAWIDRFACFLKHKSPENIIIEDVKQFLTDLAVKRNVAATTQNQAFNALLFLFRHILGRPDEFDVKSGVVRAKSKKYIPVVLSREEIDQIIGKLRLA